MITVLCNNQYYDEFETLDEAKEFVDEMLYSDVVNYYNIKQ